MSRSAWNLAEVHAALVACLRDVAQALDAEQAVRGLDTLDETAIHPILERGLSRRGLRVLREQPYPSAPAVTARRSERLRCDLVILPEGARRLADDVEAARERARAEGTLFSAAAAAPEPGMVQPQAACWVEVKVVGQFAFTRGVPGPNTGYGSELTRAFTQDLIKLGSDSRILAGGAAMVIFTDSQATAHHDLTEALHRALDQGAAFRAPIEGSFAITDRIGNACCTVALIPAEPQPEPE